MEWMEMTVKLERFSSNIINIIDSLLKNQEICNLVGQNGNIPVEKPVLPQDIAPYGKNERIYPYPFDIDYTDDVRSQIHVYYPSFSFENNGHATEIIVIFDVVVHKKIWLMTDNKKKVIRAYEIIKNIVSSMNDKKIDGIGKIHFVEGSHTIINSEFEGVRLVAKLVEF